MRDATNEQLKNPLQLGQTLFEVLDATIVATPKGSTTARYNRVPFNSRGGSPQEPVELGEYKDIIDVKSATDMHVGKQHVFILSKTGLIRIGSDGSSSSQTTWTLDTSNLVAVVDLNPEQIITSSLLLAGQDKDGAFILPFDCVKGVAGKPIRVPSVIGTVLDGLLVRSQLDAHLILLTVHNEELIANDLGDSILKQGLCSGTITSVTLGKLQSGGVVSSLAVSMLANTSNQQLAVAFPDSTGDCQVVLLAYRNDSLALFATLTPNLSFAQRERSVFRLAAGDLLVNNVDQLIVGYTATYGSVRGCAALILIELLEPEATAVKGTLNVLNTFVGANKNQQPFASIDLHLSAGLFGEVFDTNSTDPKGVLGVLLLGAGATIEQLFAGEASILAGLVTVNPTKKSFPSIQADVPGEPMLISTLATINANASGFFGLPSDVTGLSVVLGSPTLSQTKSASQILAIIQAPPYEASVSTNKPTLTFSQSDNKVEGYNVSSNKMWMFSQDTGVNIGIEGQTLGRHVNNSYGYGFDKISDSSTNTLVQVSNTITDNDLLVLYAMSYYVWTYPVFRKSKLEAPDGYMAVIFPMLPSPVQTFTPLNIKTFGFVPISQNGSLLTYLNVPRDGFRAENSLFSQEDFPVTQEPGGATVTFDQTKMIGENINQTYTVHNSASDSANFSFSKNLFNYIPVSFGLNISESSTYSENDVQTTMLSHTTMMGITISSGAVKDIGFEYQITPYIYQHDTMGCLMVNYDVELYGQSWHKHFNVPRIMLIAPYASSQDLILAGFSRSITFKNKEDGTVDVNVSLFNNALVTAKQVTCEFFLGVPKSDGKKLSPPDNSLGTMTLEILKPTERGTVSMNVQLKENDRISVKVYSDGLSSLGKVYWGIYPLSAFADLELSYGAIRTD